MVLVDPALLWLTNLSNEGTKVIEVNLRCRCGSVIRPEGSEILKATGFAKELVDPEEPEDSDCWLEWLYALEDSTPRYIQTFSIATALVHRWYQTEPGSSKSSKRLFC